MSEQQTEVMAVLQKMQQQLVYLEKKLDTLLQQSQQRPSFNREMNSQRPFRPFNRPNRPNQGHGHPSHGTSGYGQGHGHGPKKPFYSRSKNH